MDERQWGKFKLQMTKAGGWCGVSISLGYKCTYMPSTAHTAPSPQKSGKSIDSAVQPLS